jgi:hypothetical protein
MAKKTAPRRKPKKPPRKTGSARAGARATRKRGKPSKWSKRQLQLRRQLRGSRVRLKGGRVLNVERSLLKKGDPLRRAPYAGGAKFPMTVKREKGSAAPAAATASCKDARSHLGLNQSDFAALLGKNDSTVEAWESPNPVRRIAAPPFMQQLFGAFMHAQAPNGWELRRMIKVDGPVRAMFWLLRSAFEGPRLRSALDEKTIAPKQLRRPPATMPWDEQHQRQRDLVAEAQREVDAALAANPAGAAAVDAATVVYKR